MSGTVMIIPRDSDDEVQIAAALRAAGHDYQLSTASPRLAFVVTADAAAAIGRGVAETPAEEPTPTADGGDPDQAQPAEGAEPARTAAPAKPARTARKG